MLKIIFLGDYCNSEQEMPKLEPAVQELFHSADLICVNFEAPIFSAELIPMPKTGPAIGQLASSLQTCREWGFTHFSLANNHIMDYGYNGLVSTMGHLQDMPHFGAGLNFDQAYQPCWVEAPGMRIALLSFAEAQFGVLQDEHIVDQAGYAWIEHPRARKAVREAREKADWLIVQVHAGLEMVDLPLPEWRQRYRELIDLGADLVIGHHPHVIQGSETYKGKMIYYSLGNFYMDVMLKQADSGSGAALVVTLDVNSLKTEFVPLKTTLSGVVLDESDTGSSKYKQLCNKLSNENDYYVEIQAVCDEFWEQIYSGYYESALFGLGTRPHYKSVYKLLRRLAGWLLRGHMNSRANELMLIHNIRIETHRWVVERALKKSSGFAI